jgi:hypothetical protein
VKGKKNRGGEKGEGERKMKKERNYDEKHT